MARRLRCYSLATATLLLSFTFPLQIVGILPQLSLVQAQSQTTQDRKAEAVRLFQEADELSNQPYNPALREKALETFQRALVIFQEIGDKAGEGKTLLQIGLRYSLRNSSDRDDDYTKALDSYERALAIFREMGDKAREGEAFLRLGNEYSDREPAKALNCYEQALAIYRQLGDKAGEGNTIFLIGSIYLGTADYPKALDFSQQALAIYRRLGDKENEWDALYILGMIYHRLNQYAKCIEVYEQALAIRRQLGYKDSSDRMVEASTLANIGQAYNSLGQDSNALKFYEQALAIRRQVNDGGGEAKVLDAIAGIYFRQGQYSEALELYHYALAVYREVVSGGLYLAIREEAGVLHDIGDVYSELGQYPKALEFYQQALATLEKVTIVDYQWLEGRIFNSIGFVYQKLGHRSRALQFYDQALIVYQQFNDNHGKGVTLTHIGNLLKEQGYYAEAEQKLFEAITIFESLRPGLKDDQKVSIFETQANSYRSLQVALIAQSKISTALEISERGRAKALVELLASTLSVNPNNQSTIDPLKIQQIQEIAREQNATLVEYSVFPDGLYIWVVKPTGEVAFKWSALKSLNTSLEDLVTNSRQSMGVRGRSLEVSYEPGLEQSDRLKQLHKILIEPITQYLPTNPNDRVIFVPQNELFLVPFPALQDTSGKYLIQKHTILTAPSIQVLQLTHEKRQAVSGDGVLVVGNPTMPSVTTTVGEASQPLTNLPGAQKEATAIAELLNTKALTGKQATKAAILPKLSNARIIHLATHGLLDDFRGLGVPGAIALAPNGTGELNDGLLTSNEIFDLKLNAELVVLSACDTGRGRVTGDGVIGLSRSLITAGVPSVIVSLWSVPDAPTASLMTQFYQNLQKNPDKAQALRQAMLTTMKNHPNPRDWAAFTLIGEAQ
jgi:CHAT domain-containing protein/Tfp pilus assembly protein PilF